MNSSEQNTTSNTDNTVFTDFIKCINSIVVGGQVYSIKDLSSQQKASKSEG